MKKERNIKLFTNSTSLFSHHKTYEYTNSESNRLIIKFFINEMDKN